MFPKKYFYSYLFTVSPNLKGAYLSFRQISSEDCYPQILMNLAQWSAVGSGNLRFLGRISYFIPAISLLPPFGLHMNNPKFFQLRKLRRI